MCVDINDLTRLSSIAGDYDIIVNTAGPTSKVQVPALLTGREDGIHFVELDPATARWLMWIIATGCRKGRRASYMCWPAFRWEWTVVSLTIVTMRILRGEVSARGVLPHEACFELLSFFKEAAKYVSEEHRGKPLLEERFEWLE